MDTVELKRKLKHYSKGVNILWRTPTRVIWLLTFISVVVLIPFPWQKEELFYAGVPDRYTPFEEFIRFESIGVYLNILTESIGFPTKLSHYNVYFKIRKPANSPKGDASKIIVSMRKNSPFLSYARNAFEEHTSTYSASLNSGSDNVFYELHVGDEIRVAAVPLSVPISYSSGHIVCSTSDGPCPDFFEGNYMQEAVYVYAVPNIFSIMVQVLLIFAFWVVIVNAILGIPRTWR